MKPLISLSVASLALAVAADQFSPQIGVQSFTATTESVLLPVKFNSLNKSAISARELVCTNNLTVGTSLYVFQNGAYTSWVLDASGWTATARVSDTELNPTAPDPTQTLVTGSAIWITPVNGKTFSIYGKVIESKTSMIERQKTNLLANPTGALVSGEALATKLAGVAQAKDKISPIGDSFAGNYVYTGSSWTHVVGTTVTENAVLPDLGANQGFWYVSKSALDDGKSNTIQW